MVKLQIDRKRYFQLLNNAANDPNCAGVVVCKKRNAGIEAANMEFASMELKQGKSFSIGVKEESQSYIDKWITALKEFYNVDAQYKKLYSVKFTEDGIFEDKNKFIGYEISIKK